MKVTHSQPSGIAGVMAGNAPAGGVTVIDSGGYYTGTTLEAILAEIGAGLSPGAFLTVIGGGKGTVQALGSLGTTELIDLANGNKFWGTLNANCTITTTGWTNLKDCTISVELIQDGTGGWTPTFSGVTWIDGTPIWVTTAGTVTHVVLFSRDGGTTIYGAVVGGTSAAVAAAAEVAHVHINNVTFSGDAVTTAFTLPAAPVDEFAVAAYVAGVRTSVTLSGTLLDTMTFGAAPASGTDNIIVDIPAVVV